MGSARVDALFDIVATMLVRPNVIFPMAIKGATHQFRRAALAFLILDEPDGMIRVKVNGVDVFDPATGEIRSDDTKGIACWFIDTDYDEASFFVRQAYFLGANEPYKSLKTALKAEIDEGAWETLYRDTSRPFPRPETGRIAVKVINHFGDEVLKVFGV